MTPSDPPHPPTSLAVVEPQQSDLDLRRKELDRAVSELATAARSPNTWKAYESDWKIFESFCASHGEQSMPASVGTLCRFITDLHKEKGRKISTIHRILSSISQAHVLAKKPNPRLTTEVREFLKAVRRLSAGRKVRKADALMPARMRSMLGKMSQSPRGLRDRAVLLLGISSGFRRSEIANLDIRNVRFVREGMLIDLGVTKTDQEGTHDPIPILYGSRPEACPVRAIQDWIACLGKSKGFLFPVVTPKGRIKTGCMSDRAVSRLLKHLGKAIGLSDEQVALLSGHSLRSGFITTSALLGTPFHEIKKISRHESDTILMGYMRVVDQWTNNATRGITDADF